LYTKVIVKWPLNTGLGEFTGNILGSNKEKQ
jgi:hypothetical protein